ncbi:hypothetical protein Cni_G16787 [Canna indica]|uniref:Glycine-rich protein n=1 Tax=Canna indica TaxID=4628 RepID=A0AAQ3KFW1_9LILI|nr:hypothetical protein Cni_G16787 [Canna indica]
MASSGTETATTAAAADGPVLSMMNKRLRALRKKHNRILQMEERLAQGKPLNKEQEEVLRSKPAVVTLIDEYEKLRQPLAAAVQEELARAAAALAPAVSPPPSPAPSPAPATQEEPPTSAAEDKEDPDRAVIDILTLLYFGYLFDVKPQSDFAAMMLTRTHERGCCLTYDYVTDDATDLLVEQDLDAISALGSLVTSRPVYSGVSHKNALQVCLQHAKLWLMNAEQPIHPGAPITYAGLREKLNKILASDYFTTTPEMKAPGDVAAAVGKYGAACQVQISESTTVPSPMFQTEGVPVPVTNQEKEDEQQEVQPKEVHPEVQEVPSVDESLKMYEPDMVSSPLDSASNQEEQQNLQPDVDDQNQRDVEQREQQYTSRRPYHNYRGPVRGSGGAGGGRRGYSNGRGGSGRGGRGGSGGYQNGRSQYYDSGHYSRNYYNTRGRGRAGGSAAYNYGGHVSSANVELDTSA